MTMMELLVAGAISLIASGGMLILMVNTLGTGSQTVKMARLTQEMRSTMQIMTRELRRANYHAGFMNCFGNTGCLTEMPVLGDITSKVGAINITDSGDSDCFWFWYDRPQSGTQVAVTAESVAAFRHTKVGEVGKIQMTTSRTSAPVCGSDTDWVDITDPDVIDVVAFNVSDANSLTETINTAGDTQSIERIGLTMSAKLAGGGTQPVWVQNKTYSTRVLQEFVKVRNNTTARAP
jgi:type II secretory pathway component PulJ